MAKLSCLTRQAPRWSQIQPQAAFLTIIMGKSLVFTTMWKESFWSLGLVVEMYISRSVLTGYATVWWTRGRISAALSVIGYSCMHSSVFHPNLSAYWRSGVAVRRARSKYGPYQKENVWHQLLIQFHNNGKSRQCRLAIPQLVKGVWQWNKWNQELVSVNPRWWLSSTSRIPQL